MIGRNLKMVIYKKSFLNLIKKKMFIISNLNDTNHNLDKMI